MDPSGGVRMPSPPDQRTGFFGGEHKLAELTELLSAPENRVVTVTGAPGAGKTRLAIEWARPRRLARPDEVGFVELTPVIDPSADAVAATIGIALGLEVPGREPMEERSGDPSADAVAVPIGSALGRKVGPMEERLVEALAGREAVLVLDNCEHVVEAVSEIVDHLLDACPQLRIVATSRHPLEVKGERLCEVRPLELGPSVDLFTHHARRVSSTFGGHDDDLQEICRRLDGLPLAIELAAAWTRSLTPAQIVGHLERVLPLLEGSGRQQSQHHRTLQEAVGRSYELLDTATGTMFARLSVFVGGFDLEGAGAVAPDLDEHEVLRLVTSLVKHSLVIAEDGVSPAKRYRLLEPLRQYGSERLRLGGDEQAVRRRHAEHYVALARRVDDALRGPHRWERLHLLDRETGNLHAALQWAHDQPDDPDDLELRLCAALAHWWTLRGRADEGRAWLVRALASDTDDLRLRATALSRASRLAFLQQDYRQARTLLEESLAITDGLGDLLASARRRRNLAAVAMAEEDFDLAIECCERSLEVFRRHGDGSGVAWSLLFRGFSLYFKEDMDAGERYLQEALVVGRTCGNIAVTGWAYAGLSLAARAAGDVASQRIHLTGYLDLVRRAEGVHQEPDWLWVGFALAAAEGRLDAALRLAGAAEARGRREGTNINHRFKSSLLQELGRIRRGMGARAPDLEAEGAEMRPEELIDEALARPRAQPSHGLTAREIEVALLVAGGLTNQEIGERLYNSPRTVERHLTNVYRKLGLSNRAALASWAQRHLSP